MNQQQTNVQNNLKNVNVELEAKASEIMNDFLNSGNYKFVIVESIDKGKIITGFISEENKNKIINSQYIEIYYPVIVEIEKDVSNLQPKFSAVIPFSLREKIFNKNDLKNYPIYVKVNDVIVDFEEVLTENPKIKEHFKIYANEYLFVSNNLSQG